MPKTIFSKKLHSGDEIRVIAPSCSASTMDTQTKKHAEKNARAMGLVVTYGAHAFERDILDASSIKSRVADIHAAFKDKNVKGIACVRGGFNANTLLPYLDWELIRKNPKPIWGFSDITVLANAIYAKTGLVTYIGPNFSSFGTKDIKGISLYTLVYWSKCLMEDAPYEIFPGTYSNERKSAPKRNPGFEVIREGVAEGEIIGGHLSTTNLLQGTEYMPNIKNKILFIEEDDFGGDLMPLEFERNLESLLQLPEAETIRGIVIGRFQSRAKMTSQKLHHIFASKKLSKHIPIITNADFGHTYPKFTFPVGGTVRIEAKGKKARIEILKH